MKFTQVAPDTFKKLQLNAGVLLSDFDPSTGVIDREKIIAATGGGVAFNAAPEFIDFGDDIDNIPANTMELKRIDTITVTMSGTAKTIDTAVAKRFMGAADYDQSAGKLTPRSDLRTSDFDDIWWVGDYSDVNTGSSAGFIAIQLLNALNTGGFQIQSNDNGKGDFSFEFTGHYSLEDITVVPYNLYISGEPVTSNAQLSALSITGVTLTPTFAPSTQNYTGTTTASTGTITATPADNSATVEIFIEDDDISSGKVATWEDGDNVLSVIVTNDDARMAYAITITKE